MRSALSNPHLAVRRVSRYLTLAGMLLALGLVSGGCATNSDSDMPWNQPQSWEGAPSIPGFNNNGR